MRAGSWSQLCEFECSARTLMNMNFSSGSYHWSSAMCRGGTAAHRYLNPLYGLRPMHTRAHTRRFATFDVACSLLRAAPHTGAICI